MDDFNFARVVIPRATWSLRPSHGVSTPIWLSVNCYCFAPHHKSLSLLYLLSVATLFFPKIISLTMYLPHGYISASLSSRRPKDFGNPNKNQTRSKTTHARVRVCPPSSFPPSPPPPPPCDWCTCHASFSRFVSVFKP